MTDLANTQHRLAVIAFLVAAASSVVEAQANIEPVPAGADLRLFGEAEEALALRSSFAYSNSGPLGIPFFVFLFIRTSWNPPAA